jgi:HAD superfamily hydrolase (TIGR01549 family)
LPNAFPGVDASLQAVIFDFDGIIVESTEIKSEAFRALFADHATHVEEIVALHQRHGGVDRLTKIEMIYRDILHEPLDIARKELLARRFEQLVEERVIECPMVKGAAPLLAVLNGRVPMAITSGTPEAELNRIVRRRGLASFFAIVRGSPPGKSELVKEILARECWAPERVLMLGDALTDYEAARDNGLMFIGRHVPSERNQFPPDIPQVSDLASLAQAAARCFAPDRDTAASLP